MDGECAHAIPTDGKDLVEYHGSEESGRKNPCRRDGGDARGGDCGRDDFSSQNRREVLGESGGYSLATVELLRQRGAWT